MSPAAPPSKPQVQRGVAEGLIDGPPALKAVRSEEEKKRKYVLNVIEMASPSHVIPGAWRKPGDTSLDANGLKYWTDLAQLLERGKFHSVFIADVLGAYDVFEGKSDAALEDAVQISVIDPLMLVSAMAAATKSISFALTHSTTYEAPYTVARRYASLDHLTEGRVGWNIVTSHFNSAAKNFGLVEQVDHDERYVRADEFMDVSYKLFESSWRDDAVVADKERGVYAEPSRVRKINHAGKYYSVEGPSGVAPSVQRTPLLYQAGGSPAGLRFAAKHAEAAFFLGSEVPKIRKAVDTLRALAEQNGRDPFSLKIILGLTVIIDATDELAEAKAADVRKWASARGTKVLIGGWTGVDLDQFGPDDDLLEVAPPHLKGIIQTHATKKPHIKKWTADVLAEEVKVGGIGHLTVVGSPTTVADRLHELVQDGDVDGFNFIYATQPGTFADLVEFLVPELQRRGVHWDDYPTGQDGTTLTARESLYGPGQRRLRSDHYGSKFAWGVGQEPPSLE